MSLFIRMFLIKLLDRVHHLSLGFTNNICKVLFSLLLVGLQLGNNSLMGFALRSVLFSVPVFFFVCSRLPA